MYPVLDDNSSRYFKDRNKNNLAWGDVAAAMNFRDSMCIFLYAVSEIYNSTT